MKVRLPLHLLFRSHQKPVGIPPPVRLIHCCECGEAVSTQASICPHCGRSPRHKRCAICCKDEKPSALINYQYSTATSRSGNTANLPPASSRFSRVSRARATPPAAVQKMSATTDDTPNRPLGANTSGWAHERCLNAVRNTPQQSICPDCGHTNRFLVTNAPLPDCENCGRSIARAACKACGQPLIRSDAYRFSFSVKGGRFGNTNRVEGYFHPQCRSGIEKRGEEIEKRRIAHKQCRFCGEPLGLPRRFFSDHHAHCHSVQMETAAPWRVG